MHFINYQNQDLPFTINFSVIKNTCGKLQIDLKQFESTISNPEHTLTMALESFKQGHKIEGKDFKLTLEDVEDILNENYGDFVHGFTEDVLKVFSKKK